MQSQTITNRGLMMQIEQILVFFKISFT